MKEEELKKWFLNKFNSSYPVKHEDYSNNIFWYYDELFIRKVKLCLLSGDNIVLPDKVRGRCIFYQDVKCEILYCDYDEIWSIFEKEYINDYDEIQKLIKSWLKDALKMDVYTSQFYEVVGIGQLKDTLKMDVYTSLMQKSLSEWLKDVLKMDVYTSCFSYLGR